MTHALDVFLCECTSVIVKAAFHMWIWRSMILYKFLSKLGCWHIYISSWSSEKNLITSLTHIWVIMVFVLFPVAHWSNKLTYSILPFLGTLHFTPLVLLVTLPRLCLLRYPREDSTFKYPHNYTQGSKGKSPHFEVKSLEQLFHLPRYFIMQRVTWSDTGIRSSG